MPPVERITPIEEHRTFTQADFDLFAKLSGDANPIHVDPSFAADTRFGATVAHGMLLFSAVRGLISRHFPGSRLVRQQLMFAAPTYAGEPVTLRLNPIERTSGRALRLQTVVMKPDGSLGLQGECELLLGGETA
jgi:3-hydroxybutyryl-CoA dehydratase